MTITVEGNFVITGRGLVVSGKSDGLIMLGDTYALEDGTEFIIRGIERFVNMLGQPPELGEKIGILLGDVDRDLIPVGSVLYRQGNNDPERVWHVKLFCGHEHDVSTFIGDFDYMDFHRRTSDLVQVCLDCRLEGKEDYVTTIVSAELVRGG